MGRGAFRDSSTDFNMQRNRENWDGSNRNGSRSGLRGRGGRGMPINAGSSNKNEDSIMTTDINLDQNTEVKKDSETKRERKSRWVDNNETSDTIDEPITTQNAVSTSDNVQPANENEMEVEQLSDKTSDEVSHKYNELSESQNDNGDSAFSQANGCIYYSNCSSSENNEQLTNIPQNNEYQPVSDQVP